eukprot:3398698-Amphidinium_carterae.1
MYKGHRRVLVNGAVSTAYQARSGLPAGCALAVDLLDCFLSRVLGQARIRDVSVRKYVDDFVLYATGKHCGNTTTAGVQGSTPGHVLSWHGALDGTFLTEQRTAAGKHQDGVFLDCNNYEQVPLSMLEQFAIESGYPPYALNVALNIYSGQRRILVQGAVSEGVTATCGLPPGCGHAVDMLHAACFLIKSLRCLGREVDVRKYVDDMVLISSGPCFAGNLCFAAYRPVLRSLKAVNMRVNALKTVVLCNGAGGLPPVQITTRDLGVDTQWFAWGNPVQQKRISSFRASMYRTRALGLPAHVKARTVKSLFSLGLYGAEVGGKPTST